jgi:hypothetical protein
MKIPRNLAKSVRLNPKSGIGNTLQESYLPQNVRCTKFTGKIVESSVLMYTRPPIVGDNVGALFASDYSRKLAVRLGLKI